VGVIPAGGVPAVQGQSWEQAPAIDPNETSGTGKVQKANRQELKPFKQPDERTSGDLTNPKPDDDPAKNPELNAARRHGSSAAQHRSGDRNAPDAGMGKSQIEGRDVEGQTEGEKRTALENAPDSDYLEHGREPGSSEGVGDGNKGRKSTAGAKSPGPATAGVDRLKDAKGRHKAGISNASASALGRK